jgi:hypothetical protein
MKRYISLCLLAVVSLSLGGCFVYSQPRGRAVARQAPSRECPPSTHWDDGRCVHNGHGHGNGNGHGRHDD